MENQIYNWFVKKGNILIQRDDTCISLKLNGEKGESCLLTRSDNDDIIQLLTKIAKEIWEDPDYERKPYPKQLCQEVDNVYYWDIEESRLMIKYNEIENAVEIGCDGSQTLNLEINYAVEIIQVLEHFNQ
ncbi:hypothetical protein [Flavobacterium sp.]|uniref:hypothetical protein n=1 Tax=Flavobacterium sp. TaxID=239 RepID=UPI002621A4A3|nr:hypothetical protein [Flavobacterium sp.]